MSGITRVDKKDGKDSIAQNWAFKRPTKGTVVNRTYQPHGTAWAEAWELGAEVIAARVEQSFSPGEAKVRPLSTVQTVDILSGWGVENGGPSYAGHWRMMEEPKTLI